ncbi:MAG: hypothetical protein KF794_11485 [Xanthobacteraceae bacterium]|nr:hypothetical protein [Xanthobacteraceae bacterium]QYK44392.1 MAG: hypothetical protein KF794_11485 [Xanthobacteraceae bacterium]
MELRKFAAHSEDLAQEANSFRACASVLHIALAATLILSIALILTVAGAGDALAQTRPDVMIMEESSKFSTALVLGGILVVMAVLTVMALRDCQPEHTKRAAEVRRNGNSRRQA